MGSNVWNSEKMDVLGHLEGEGGRNERATIVGSEPPLPPSMIEKAGGSGLELLMCILISMDARGYKFGWMSCRWNLLFDSIVIYINPAIIPLPACTVKSYYSTPILIPPSIGRISQAAFGSSCPLLLSFLYRGL
ncbi:hypothetical protein CDAR_207451 [Caerostris darwini]|uniref:Uncharacterized protein n=1 Tax=Caerostris darwini TaxID=1538125 RepID=A0AAV4VGF2_9ARAC|nr:hypothetical protein CDAR_207451 [Caerostris darwini]